MTQRRVENTRVHFWTFSPVSVNSLLTLPTELNEHNVIVKIFSDTVTIRQ